MGHLPRGSVAWSERTVGLGSTEPTEVTRARCIRTQGLPQKIHRDDQGTAHEGVIVGQLVNIPFMVRSKYCFVAFSLPFWPPSRDVPLGHMARIEAPFAEHSDVSPIPRLCVLSVARIREELGMSHRW